MFELSCFFKTVSFIIFITFNMNINAAMNSTGHVQREEEPML